MAKQGSAPIRGLVRAEFVPESRARSFPLADRNMEPAYPAIDPEDPDLKLTVRDLTDGPRQIVPRSRWRLAREENGKPVASRGHVFMSSGFEPGRIYELVYPAENPVLVGLGLAATRDFIAFLKYGGALQDGSSAQGLGSTVRRAIGFGTSQSGRFLRTFLYYGFNQDERERRVFDRHPVPRGRRQPRQLQPPIRPALQGCPLLHEHLLSHRHLPLCRSSAVGPRKRPQPGGPRPQPAAGVHPQNLLHQRFL